MVGRRWRRRRLQVRPNVIVDPPDLVITPRASPRDPEEQSLRSSVGGLLSQPAGCLVHQCRPIADAELAPLADDEQSGSRQHRKDNHGQNYRCVTRRPRYQRRM